MYHLKPRPSPSKSVRTLWVFKQEGGKTGRQARREEGQENKEAREKEGRPRKESPERAAAHTRACV
jgi:hypothetical protein